VSRLVLGPTQPHIQWVKGTLYPSIKWPEFKADYSPPSTAEAKECVELYIHYPTTSSCRGA